MSRIRLYVDEDAAEQAIVDGLVAAGFDVLTTHQASTHGDSDLEQLSFATGEGRAMYTLNVSDFARLHTEFLAAGRDHAGIIVIPRQRYAIGEKLRRLLSLLNIVTAEGMRNQIRFL